jgi:hypothetical protein
MKCCAACGNRASRVMVHGVPTDVAWCHRDAAIIQPSRGFWRAMDYLEREAARGDEPAALVRDFDRVYYPGVSAGDMREALHYGHAWGRFVQTPVMSTGKGLYG